MRTSAALSSSSSIIHPVAVEECYHYHSSMHVEYDNDDNDNDDNDFNDNHQWAY